MRRFIKLWIVVVLCGAVFIASAQNEQTLYAVADVNVRETPTTASAVVDVLRQGQAVTVVDSTPTGEVLTIGGLTSSLWYRVRLADGSEGFVWFGLLEERVTPTPAAPGEIASTLAQLGISPESGYRDIQAEDDITVDTSGMEAQLHWHDFGGYQDNFVMRAEIVWGQGAASDTCGFLFREGFFDSYYLVRISREGELTFIGKLWDEWLSDFHYGNGDLINTAPDATNEMILVAVDDHYTVYLNGEYAGQFVDNNLMNGSSALLAGVTQRSDSAGCTFRDAWVWSLLGDTPAMPTPTASPPGMLNPAIEEGLALAGFDHASGRIGDTLIDHTIDMTGEENLITYNNLYGSYDNFVMGTTFRWGPGAEADECALVFRMVDGDNYHTFRLDRYGELAFRERINDALSDRIYFDGSAINTGADEQNTVVLVGIDTTYTVYVNGVLSAQHTDDTFEGGEVGVAAVTFEDSDVSYCTFDYSWVWELTGDVAQIASPTPTPDVLDTFISDGLALVGVTPDEGELVAQYDRLVMSNYTSDTLVSAIGGDVQNFVLGTDFTLNTDLPESDCVIGFRQGGQDIYFLYMFEDEVVFQAVVGGEVVELRDVYTGDLPLRHDGSDSLVLAAVDDTFSLYINGVYITQFQDAALAEGNTSLLALFDAGGASCEYSNTWLWNLGEGGPAVPTLTPTPLPVPDTAVLDMLAVPGIPPESGYIAERIERAVLDLTGLDSIQRREFFNNRYGDFVLGTRFTWGPGAETDSCGVIVRYTDESDYYIAAVDQTGRGVFTHYLDNRVADLVRFEAPAVEAGEGESNDLVVVAAGRLLTVYINGEYVAQYRNLKYSESAVGLLADTGVFSDETDCTFENAILWTLAYEAPVIATPTPSPTPSPSPTLTPSPTPTPTTRPADV